jgi:phosphoribosylanthranilate isomerase
MMVKICGITNREDAQAAVEGGAAALGFNFYSKSPRYVTPEVVAHIIEGLPASVWKVGVFVNEPPEEVERVLAAAGLNVAQLHGDEPPEALPRGTRVWKALRVDKSFDPAAMDAYDAEAFVLDAPSERYGGSGRTFDWSKARHAAKKIILAGGLDAGNVQAAIRLARPWGVDSCSRLESSPGRKDHARMARFLEAALAESVE